MPLSMNLGDDQNKGRGYLEVNTDIYQSFTGSDIKAVFTTRSNGQPVQKTIGSLSAITVTVVREVTPLYGMGSADPRGVSRGKRAITGSMSFTVFDRDPLVRDFMLINDLKALESQYQDFLTAVNTEFDESASEYMQLQPQTYLKSVTDAVQAARSLQQLVAKQPIRYADQLAPFDITISFANDQMAASSAAIRQVYIVTQGIGLSSHDTENEQVYTYVALAYEPMTPVSERLRRADSVIAKSIRTGYTSGTYAIPRS